MPEPFDLQRLRLPEDAPYRELLDRCPHALLRRYVDDELLVLEGAESGEVFLVLQGACVVETATGPGAAARPQSLAIIQATPAAPAFVGEMAALGGGFRTATVRCSGAVFAVVLQPQDLDFVINELPFFTRGLCRQLADRLREANELIKDYQHQTALEADLVVRQPGEIIFKKDSPALNLFQVVDGTVRITDGEKEKTVTPAQLPEGFLEPAPFFQNTLHQTTAIAHTTTMLVSISNRSIRAVARRYPDLLINLYRGQEA